MAIMIPNEPYKNATDGEKRVFRLLETQLPDDYIVWSELRINERYPDFVVVGPELGILVLEVKDWSINNIRSIYKDKIIFKNHSEKSNPFNQANTYKMNIFNLLQKNLKGYKKGNRDYLFPCNHAVVFTNISKSEFDYRVKENNDEDIKKVFNNKFILFQDQINEIIKNGKPMRLIEKLVDMKDQTFGEKLGKEIIKEIRKVLYPEIVISDSNSDTIISMEIKQEQYAKTINDGCNVIKGIAGSGKSVILVARGKYLREMHRDWNILVLTYNKTLSKYYTEIFDKSSSEGKFDICTFHSFAIKALNLINNDVRFNENDKRIEYLLNHIDKIDKLDVDNKYDAILIDEGQDFECDWLKLVTYMLKVKEKSHLLITSDGAQNIYDRDYILENAGIQNYEMIILDSNYRNTEEIIGFSSLYLMDTTEDNDTSYSANHNNYFTLYKNAYRNGENVEVLKGNNVEEEIEMIMNKVRFYIDSGYKLKDIAILSPVKGVFSDLSNKLAKDYKVFNISDNKDDLKFEDDSIKLCTIKSAKGFEFKIVILYGLNGSSRYLNNKEIFVGMTRAVDKLIIIYSKENYITNAIKYVYDRLCILNGKLRQAINDVRLIDIEEENRKLDIKRLELEQDIVENSKAIEKHMKIIKNRQSQLEIEREKITQEKNQLDKQLIKREEELEKKYKQKYLVNRRPNKKSKLHRVSAVLLITMLIFVSYKTGIATGIRSGYRVGNASGINETSEPVMTFEVGDTGDNNGTWIEINGIEAVDINNKIAKVFRQGSKISFYKNKRVQVKYNDGTLQEYLYESSILKIEVANDYTTIYHNDRNYKNPVRFKYDFNTNEIIQ